jgi:hypothetical protein
LTIPAKQVPADVIQALKNLPRAETVHDKNP